MGKVFAVGVGPGSPKYVTEIVKEILQNCDIVIGYKYTLKTIEKLIEGKEIYEITMNDQEKSYQCHQMLLQHFYYFLDHLKDLFHHIHHDESLCFLIL